MDLFQIGQIETTTPATVTVARGIGVLTGYIWITFPNHGAKNPAQAKAH